MNLTETQTARKTAGAMVLVLLVFLTVFSSCNFRKPAQALLGVPVTKQLNVAKTTLQTSHGCQVLPEITITTNHDRQHDFQVHLAGFAPVIIPQLPQAFAGHSKRPLPEILSSGGDIPFYILYKKMKLFA